MAGPRARTAIHEAGHAVTSIILLGEGPVSAASIRPGKGHLGVTLMTEGLPGTREDAEKDIIVTLAGDEAVKQVGLSSEQPQGDTPDEVAGVTATLSLEHLAPLVRDRLLGAEAMEPDPELADGPKSWRQAQRLDEYQMREASAHLDYLTVVTEGVVARHTYAIRRVAEALFAETTLDGATVAAIVHRARCVCHAEWTTTAGLLAQEPTDIPVG
jgi:hypothetical protein